MITEEMTKSQFIVEVLQRDVKNIYLAQLLIAEKNIRLQGQDLQQKKRRGPKIGTRTGDLLQSLQNPKYSIAGVNGAFRVEANNAIQTRFLDMKHLGNWKIYNRQVWGILYRNSLFDVKYGYGSQIRNHLGEALHRAFENAKK